MLFLLFSFNILRVVGDDADALPLYEYQQQRNNGEKFSNRMA